MHAMEILGHWRPHLPDRWKVFMYWSVAVVSSALMGTVVVAVVAWLGTTSTVIAFGDPTEFWTNTPLMVLASLIYSHVDHAHVRFGDHGGRHRVRRPGHHRSRKDEGMVSIGRPPAPRERLHSHMHIPEIGYDDHTQP